MWLVFLLIFTREALSHRGLLHNIFCIIYLGVCLKNWDLSREIGVAISRVQPLHLTFNKVVKTLRNRSFLKQISIRLENRQGSDDIEIDYPRVPSVSNDWYLYISRKISGIYVTITVVLSKKHPVLDPFRDINPIMETLSLTCMIPE